MNVGILGLLYLPEVVHCFGQLAVHSHVLLQLGHLLLDEGVAVRLLQQMFVGGGECLDAGY